MTKKFLTTKILSKKFLMASFATLSLVAFMSTDACASRMDSPQLSFRERIDSILNPAPEIQQPVEKKSKKKKKSKKVDQQIQQSQQPQENFATAEPMFYPGRPVERITLSPLDPSIHGTPLASQNQCVRFLLSKNPNPKISVSPEQLVAYYYEEGLREGIRPDVAFAQAMQETGFFRFGGTVIPEQNNYCGLGTISSSVNGAFFSSAQIGVRAHIQHLLAYSSDRPPQTQIVDPRFELAAQKTLETGKKTTWTDLNGTWAIPGNGYGQNVLQIYRQILDS